MQQPVQPQKPVNAGSRQVLIVLAVVLALLVLLCAGVISFLLKQNGSSALGTIAPPAATSVAAKTLPTASYRLIQQAGRSSGLDQASEGRQTL
jgi:serine/threonine-protein kinase